MKGALVGLLVVLLVVGLGVGGCVFSGYNQAVSLDEKTNQEWAQVENQLQRRYDLIPNLEASVKGTALQEQKVFISIAEARKAYQGARTPEEKAAAANQVESALARLLVIVEAYPELKSNEAFLKLQDALEGTENRLTVARKDYNQAVQTLNKFVRQFPGRIYASIAGVDQREYFEIEEPVRDAPKVDFSDINKEKTP